MAGVSFCQEHPKTFGHILTELHSGVTTVFNVRGINQHHDFSPYAFLTSFLPTEAFLGVSEPVVVWKA
jgi:hypothetical protein